jgi:hypothetical protein
MRLSYLYVVLVLVNPLLAWIVNGWFIATMMFLASLLVARLTKTRTSATRRMICLAVLINQLAVMHALKNIRSTQISATDIEALSHRIAPESPRPFVSIVVISDNDGARPDAPADVDSILQWSSPILTREIVVPPTVASELSGPIPITTHISDETEFVIFVSSSARMKENWMNGLVREFIANDTRMVVPIVQLEDKSMAVSSMVNSVTGDITHLVVSETTPKEVPVIRHFSALGVPRKILTRLPNLERLISEGRLMEISLRAWLCFGGIVYTRFTTVTLARTPVTDWKAIEGEDVAGKIHDCPRNEDWFMSHFKNIDDDTHGSRVLISGESTCLTVANNRRLSVSEKCDESDSAQSFEIKGSRIQSIKYNLCMDAGSANAPGKAPIAYQCMHANRNQQFFFLNGRLMWGSFCLERHQDRRVTFEYCVGIDESIKASQKWEQRTIS